MSPACSFLVLFICFFTCTSSYLSGLRWASGEATQANGIGDIQDAREVLNQLDDFRAYRRRRVDIYNSKAESETLESLRTAIERKALLYSLLYNNSIAIEQVIDFIPQSGEVPDKYHDNKIAACAGGFYNSFHEDLSRTIAQYKRRAPFVIRLGHELNNKENAYSPFNDPGHPRGNYTAYKTCFCKIANIYHANIQHPPVMIDWNWLRQPQGLNPNAVYPVNSPKDGGDNCVDIIGVDSYNNNQDIRNQTAFHDYATKRTVEGWPSGPRAWMEFARAHNKNFGIAEWGVTNLPVPEDDITADSAQYIQGMYGLFQEAIDTFHFNFFYESYFNIIATDGHDHRINDALGANRNPRASNEYKKQYNPQSNREVEMTDST